MCSLANVMDECAVGPWLFGTKPSACFGIHTFIPGCLNPFLLAMRSKLRAQYGIEVCLSLVCLSELGRPMGNVTGMYNVDLHQAV